MEHGYAKLIHGPERFAAILHTLGVPAPELMAWATILVELLGGLAVLLGAFIPLASVPMAAVLITAILTVHLQYGFSTIKLQAVTAAGAQFGPPGYEVGLLYLACLAALLLIGSGPFSIGSFLMLVSWLLQFDHMAPAHYILAVCLLGFGIGIFLCFRGSADAGVRSVRVARF
jgi:putative oxidoreductase